MMAPAVKMLGVFGWTVRPELGKVSGVVPVAVAVLA
jgi:hypothetical protein